MVSWAVAVGEDEGGGQPVFKLDTVTSMRRSFVEKRRVRVRSLLSIHICISRVSLVRYLNASAREPPDFSAFVHQRSLYPPAGTALGDAEPCVLSVGTVDWRCCLRRSFGAPAERRCSLTQHLRSATSALASQCRFGCFSRAFHVVSRDSWESDSGDPSHSGEPPTLSYMFHFAR